MLVCAAESSEPVESKSCKPSPFGVGVGVGVARLFGKTVRCTNSWGIDNFVMVFWKFNRRFDRPSAPSLAE